MAFACLDHRESFTVRQGFKMDEEEELVAKVNTLMDKITSASDDNPNPTILHAIASILEAEDSLDMKDGIHSSSSSANSLVGIIQENNEFFELISSKFLSETRRYSTSVQAAAARLFLLCCSPIWIEQDRHVFEEPVLENIRNWVMVDDDTGLWSAEEQNLNSEMLKTYSTGLLAVCLAGGGQVVEDVLKSGLSANLMRYLRLCALVELSGSPNAFVRGRETQYCEDVEDYIIPDTQSLAQLREKYCVQCLVLIGKYEEVLEPVLQEMGVDVCLALLRQNSFSVGDYDHPSEVAFLLDIMKLICALATHRKFVELFVDQRGMDELLYHVPRWDEIFIGLSSCILAIGSHQGIREKVCSRHSKCLAELSLQLLECDQDQARVNAALFFAATFGSNRVTVYFHHLDGLEKLLDLLKDAASVRSRETSGALGLSKLGSHQNDISSKKQVAYHTCFALQQFFRADFLLFIKSIGLNISNHSVGYNALDISDEAMDEVFLQLQEDRAAPVGAHWPAVEKFLASNGHITMLELCQAPPIEQYPHDLLQYAWRILHIVTLVPNSHKMIVNALLSKDRVGIAVILDAANIACSHADPKIIQLALNVLVNLVSPPPLLSQDHELVSQTSNFPPRENGDGIRDRISWSSVPVTMPIYPKEWNEDSNYVLEVICANGGINVLLHLLQSHIDSPSPSASLDCLRALACRVLVGLTRDDTSAHRLRESQVEKKLSEIVSNLGSPTLGTQQDRWQVELYQAALELNGIVTNTRHANTSANWYPPYLKVVPITYKEIPRMLQVPSHRFCPEVEPITDKKFPKALQGPSSTDPEFRARKLKIILKKNKETKLESTKKESDCSNFSMGRYVAQWAVIVVCVVNPILSLGVILCKKKS